MGKEAGESTEFVDSPGNPLPKEQQPVSNRDSEEDVDGLCGGR